MAGLLAQKTYNPGTAGSVSTASLTAMTAIDTTNLRLPAFNAPASGIVLVRSRVALTGGATFPSILLGIMEGATVMCRGQGVGGFTAQGATYSAGSELYAIVTGLGAGSHTWDLAYAVQVIIGSSVIKYGGTNDASGADAWGAATCSIWDPGPNLLGAIGYDPTTAASAGVSTLKALTAFDTTNARLTFTAPASGNVFWRIRAPYTGASATKPQTLLGILESTTVVDVQTPCVTLVPSNASTSSWMHDASGVVTGVSAGSHTWDASYAVQVVSSAGGGFKYGGPNNNSGNNAYGQLLFELWAC